MHEAVDVIHAGWLGGRRPRIRGVDWRVGAGIGSSADGGNANHGQAVWRSQRVRRVP